MGELFVNPFQRINRQPKVKSAPKPGEFLAKVAVGSTVVGFLGTVAEMLAEQNGGGLLTFDYRGSLIPIGVGLLITFIAGFASFRRSTQSS